MTKEKFQKYVNVQHSGITNMWAIDKVVELSGNKLTEKDCVDIMKNYAKYKKEYSLEK